MKNIKKKVVGKDCPKCQNKTISIWNNQYKCWKCNYCGQLYEIIIPESSNPLKEMEIPE